MKTKRIRIAVAINYRGEWSASGWELESNDWSQEERDKCMIELALESVGQSDAENVHWIEADVPIPEPTTIEGEVMT